MPLGPELFDDLKKRRQVLQDNLFEKICCKIDNVLTEKKDSLKTAKNLIVMPDGKTDYHQIKLSDIPFSDVDTKVHSRIKDAYIRAGWHDVSISSWGRGEGPFLVVMLQKKPTTTPSDSRT